MAHLIPNIITYNQIDDLIPDRNSYLDADLFTQINAKIKKNETLMFMPTSVYETHTQDKKYEKLTYKLVLFGTLIDGRRISVMVSNIDVYFDILVPNGKDPMDFAYGIDTELKAQYRDKKYTSNDGSGTETRHQAIYDPVKYEIIKAKPFKTYQENESSYVRFYFRRTTQRVGAIRFIRAKGLETASDDTSCYYRVVARTRMIPLANWAIIKKFNIINNPNIKGPIFQVNISDYVGFTGDVLNDPLLSKDKLMEFCWDIETYSPDGDLPIPENPHHKVFMISMTFGWYWAKEPFLKLCLVDMPCNPDPENRYKTVVCGTEEQLIRAFAQIYAKMQPEFNEGFNDSDYDWQWIIKRAAKYENMLSFIAECFDATNPWRPYQDDDVFNEVTWNEEKPRKMILFKREKIKLEADTNAISCTLILPGYINIDVRTVFRQLYPTAEKSSLAWFLAKNKLGGKEDMPYQKLFAIYRAFVDVRNRIQNILLDANIDEVNDGNSNYGENLSRLLKLINKHQKTLDLAHLKPIIAEIKKLKRDMAQVALYCVVDAQRCHDLMNIRSVIRDKREIADLSFTCLFDAFYRANGMKVRNLVIAHGQKRNLVFTNINDKEVADEGKYPGAYVIPPKKGLNITKLSIEERIEKYKRFKAGESTLHDCDRLAEWIDLSPEEIERCKNIINEHGAVLPLDIIEQINADEQKAGRNALPSCFKAMLLELIGRPITGLDFASLYPSLIMTYNLSPEYIILGKDMEFARQMHKKGAKLHKISFEYGGKTIRGWSIRHENHIDPSQHDCKFGVYPMILKQLFDARAALKGDLGKYAKLKEELEKAQKCDTAEYEDAVFKYQYFDSKQKALKVFMNTFYGEAGNKLSPFFLLQVAGGITTAGQRNIKLAKKYVENRGCIVHYGDEILSQSL